MRIALLAIVPCPPLRCSQKKKHDVTALHSLFLTLKGRITAVVQSVLFCTSLSFPALASEPLAPTRLRIAGQELQEEQTALTDGKEIFVPLSVLPIIRAEGKVNSKGDRIQIDLPAVKKRGEISVRHYAGKPIVLLTELAKFLDGKIVSPQPQGTLTKGKEPVALLARITSAKFEQGSLRILTSFPVPFRADTQTDTVPMRGFVDCLGAYLPENFRIAPLEAADKGKIRLTASQSNFEVARFVVEFLTQPTESGGSQSPDQVVPSTTKDNSPVLTLDAFLKQVERNYPKLIGADVERRSATAKRREKLGAFDPAFVVSTDYQDYNSSSTQGRLVANNTSDFAIEFLTPLGLKFAAGGRRNRGAVKSPDSSTGEGGEYFVSIKMPLLRGLGINEKSAAEQQARLGIPLADQTFALTRLDVLLKAASTYWKWVASGRKLQVARDLLNVADVRAKAVQERVDKGDLPRFDAVEANQEVQRRLERLANAERTLQQAAYDLALYLFEADGNPSPPPPPSLLPEYKSSLRVLTEEEQALGRKLALERRPELKSIGLSKDITRVGLRLAKNDRLPALDLVFSPGTDTGIRSVGSTMKAGIVVSFPLQNRGPDGRVADAELKIRKFEQDERFERQRLTTQVSDAHNAVNTAYQRYVAAQRSLELARELEQLERERLAAGEGTLFLVNQRERATAEAASIVIDIQAEYEQALAAFRAATVQPFVP